MENHFCIVIKSHVDGWLRQPTEVFQTINRVGNSIDCGQLFIKHIYFKYILFLVKKKKLKEYPSIC